MRTIIWSDRAMTRRDEIFDYIAADNPEAAIDLDATFELAANRLPDFPYMGITGRIKGTRELTVTSNYIIIYRVLEDIIDIITIRHAATNY